MWSIKYDRIYSFFNPVYPAGFKELDTDYADLL